MASAQNTTFTNVVITALTLTNLTMAGTILMAGQDITGVGTMSGSNLVVDDVATFQTTVTGANLTIGVNGGTTQIDSTGISNAGGDNVTVADGLIITGTTSGSDLSFDGGRITSTTDGTGQMTVVTLTGTTTIGVNGGTVQLDSTGISNAGGTDVTVADGLIVTGTVSGSNLSFDGGRITSTTDGTGVLEAASVSGTTIYSSGISPQSIVCVTTGGLLGQCGNTSNADGTCTCS